MIELISPYGRDFPMLHVRTKACTALVSLYGAQVLDWAPQGAEPVLWLSPQCVFQRGRPIRGGIPICWPWFGKAHLRPDRPSHGVARTSLWTLERAAETEDGVARMELSLQPASPLLPAAHLVIGAGRRLRMRLETSRREWNEPFSAAFHCYFQVGDREQCPIDGLADVPFTEYAAGGSLHDESPLFPRGPIDRVYHPTENDVELRDPLLRRCLRIRRRGSRSLVVWNPGSAVAAEMDDVGPGNERRFLCVETAVAPCEHAFLPQNGGSCAFECEISVCAPGA
ncbi:MAG: D-hexose-6-phosphate mutarotase [Akkermansiaceae bacterium]|nr:D-hexose-6-phosphate mutarotase [Akkermansiaceae bacterium]